MNRSAARTSPGVPYVPQRRSGVHGLRRGRSAADACCAAGAASIGSDIATGDGAAVFDDGDGLDVDVVGTAVEADVGGTGEAVSTAPDAWSPSVHADASPSGSACGDAETVGIASGEVDGLSVGDADCSGAEARGDGTGASDGDGALIDGDGDVEGDGVAGTDAEGSSCCGTQAAEDGVAPSLVEAPALAAVSAGTAAIAATAAITVTDRPIEPILIGGPAGYGSAVSTIVPATNSNSLARAPSGVSSE